jgi:hypothetical protein
MPPNPVAPSASNHEEEVIMDQNDAISVVEKLIETCRDGEKGYQDAAQHVKRTDLKSYFNQQSLERARFAQELQAELARLGKPDKKVSASATGAIHRAWIDTKPFWNRWSKAKTTPKRLIKRLLAEICPLPWRKLFGGRRPVCNARMTR